MFISFIIILGCIVGVLILLYLLIGFLIYGFLLAEARHDNEEELLKLGLSTEALNFKPESKNAKTKIEALIYCLIFGGYLYIDDYLQNGNFDLPDFSYGFKIW